MSERSSAVSAGRVVCGVLGLSLLLLVGYLAMKDPTSGFLAGWADHIPILATTAVVAIGLAFRSQIGGGGRILLFIPLTLLLWVGISQLIGEAYKRLPPADISGELPTDSAQSQSRSQAENERQSQSAATQQQALQSSRTAGLFQTAPPPPDSTRDSTVVTRGESGRTSRYYLLVLPLAMLIAGLWVWPNEPDEFDKPK